VAVALSLAACGGDGGDGGPEAEFIAKADSICRELGEKAQGIDRPDDVPGIERFAAEGKALAQDARRRLLRLDPPGELRGDFRRFLDAGGKGIQELGELERAARQRDTARIEQIADRIRQANSDQHEIAGEIGFKSCGRS
jgi:hypothetical protein